MNPEPPTFHFGTEKRLRGLVAELDGYADAIKARTGKRPRKDTAHMLAGVLSYLTMPQKTVTRSGGNGH